MYTTLKETMQEFIRRVGLTWDFKLAENNPNMPDQRNTMRHYKFTLRIHKKGIDIPFSVGSGWTRDPDVEDLFECLLSDAQCADYSYEEFCSNLGYDPVEPDSEFTWKTIARQTKMLKEFFGEHWEDFIELGAL